MTKNILKSLFIFALFLIDIQAKESNIEVYSAYGNQDRVIIEGRMLHPKDLRKVSKDDNWFVNGIRQVREIINDEIKNENIVAIIRGKSYITRGDSEGYFQFDIHSSKHLKMGYESISLHIAHSNLIYKTKATIITSKKLLGVICDIDDTVMISDVTNRFNLVINTIFKNYKQRKVVPTMAQRLTKIVEKNPSKTPSTLFFISGSPQQLFAPLEEFLRYNHFPKHTIILKKVHGENKDPLTNQFLYKTQKIERLIKLYPKMVWIMFGDSGERDREVYTYISQKYPSKVKKFYIRNIVTNEITLYNKKYINSHKK